MSDRPQLSPLVGTLLSISFRQRIIETDADAGVRRLADAARQAATPEAWHAAVAEAVRDGFIHDPVRLQAGALHCHWHLELTPKGAEAARAIVNEPRGSAG